jgi:hypothetical protein
MSNPDTQFLGQNKWLYNEPLVIQRSSKGFEAWAEKPVSQLFLVHFLP